MVTRGQFTGWGPGIFGRDGVDDGGEGTQVASSKRTAGPGAFQRKLVHPAPSSLGVPYPDNKGARFDQ